MPMFRNVESLPRRYGQSLRKYANEVHKNGNKMTLRRTTGAESESYCCSSTSRSTAIRVVRRVPEMQQQSSLWRRCSAIGMTCPRTFTTDSKNGNDEPMTADTLLPTLPPAPNLNETAMAAKVAVQSMQEDLDTDDRNSDSVFQAAQEILALTFPPQPLADQIWSSESPNGSLSDPAADLHRSLVQVTSSCLRFLERDLELILDCSMDLAQRAHDLSLPFPLPVYRDLTTAIAKHCHDGAPAAAVLQVSVWATAALQAPLNSQFFSEALLTLVETGQLQETIDLILGMKNRHDIYEIDLPTTLQMLSSLKQVLQRMDQYPAVGEDEANTAVELIEMLTRIIKKDVRDWIGSITAGSLTRTVSSLLAAKDEDDESDDEYDGDEVEPLSSSDEDDSDDSDDDATENAEHMADLLGSLTSFSKDLESSLGNVVAKARGRHTKPSSGPLLVSVKVDQETGEVQDITRTLWPHHDEAKNGIDDEDDSHFGHRRQKRNFIYNRNRADWDIPDVTSQFLSLCQVEKALYSETYEDKIWNEMVQEGEDYVDYPYDGSDVE